MNELDLQIVELARDLLLTTILLAAPVLIVGLVVGVAISLFQALTSVQEQTLSLVPKMAAVMIVIVMLLAPALRILRDYASEVFGQILVFGLS